MDRCVLARRQLERVQHLDILHRRIRTKARQNGTDFSEPMDRLNDLFFAGKDFDA